MKRSRLVEALQEKLSHLEQARRPEWGTVSSGCAALDCLLPPGGFQRGGIVEWLVGARGSGAATLAMIAAASACQRGGALVVVDRRGDFFPPAALALGVDRARLIVARPQSEADQQWALHQALQCSAVAAVWAELPKLDSRSLRRLQLAAEEGGALGLFMRPALVRGRPTWADVQLLVQPVAGAQQRRLRVEVVRCRGGAGGPNIELELDALTGEIRDVSHDAKTHSLPLVSQLADAAPWQRSTGA